MASYHFSVKAIGRSSGRSATAAAAYRAAERIVDQRTGEIHDYTRKRGVLGARLVLPGGRMEGRAEFWNRLEVHHKRGDAVLAREFTIALPAELPAEERKRLAFDYGRELAERYGVAVDVALHEPDAEGDQRNYHAHVMLSACRVGADGTLGTKAVELDPIACARVKPAPLQNFAERERPRWEQLHNERMQQSGRAERIDHRSLEAQGIQRTPTRHRGPAASGYERRTGRQSRRRLWQEQQAQAVAERLSIAAELGEAERELTAVTRSIIDTETDLQAALQERDERRAGEAAHRISNIARLLKGGGPTYIFAERATDALRAVQNDPSKVDWAAVEIATARECLEVGHDVDAVIEALNSHSPRRVDPASHEKVKAAVQRYAVNRDAKFEREKWKNSGQKGPSR